MSSSATVELQTLSNAGAPAAKVAPEAPKVVEPPKPAAEVKPAAPDELATATRAMALEKARLANLTKALNERQKKIEAQEKTIGERDARNKPLDELRRRAATNPQGVVRELLGEKWGEVLSKEQSSVAAIREEVLAAAREEMATLQKAHEEKIANLEAQLAARGQEDGQRYLADHAKSVSDWFNANSSKFPQTAAYIEAFGEPNLVAIEIHKHFNNTVTRDVAGNQVPGELLSAEQMSQRIEQRLTEAMGKRDSYLAKSKTPATTPGPGEQRQATTPAPKPRSLSNDLHAYSPTGEVTERKKEDWLQRAEAAAADSLRQRGRIQ